MPYKDKEKQREYRRKYYKEYYKKNPNKKEQLKENCRKRALMYYAANSDEVKIKARMYHAPHRRVYTQGGGIWQCFKCGATWGDGIQLDIHHKNQDNKDNRFENLVCLCKECHDRLHQKWQTETIKQLVDHELVSWEGDINECIGTST